MYTGNPQNGLPIALTFFESLPAYGMEGFPILIYVFYLAAALLPTS